MVLSYNAIIVNTWTLPNITEKVIKHINVLDIVITFLNRRNSVTDIFTEIMNIV